MHDQCCADASWIFHNFTFNVLYIWLGRREFVYWANKARVCTRASAKVWILLKFMFKAVWLLNRRCRRKFYFLIRSFEFLSVIIFLPAQNRDRSRMEREVLMPNYKQNVVQWISSGSLLRNNNSNAIIQLVCFKKFRIKSKPFYFQDILFCSCLQTMNFAKTHIFALDFLFCVFFFSLSFGRH